MTLVQASASHFKAFSPFSKEALGWAETIYTGSWLGLLDRKNLHRLDEIYYSRSSRYVDDGYNRQGLFPWERTAIETHFTKCRRLLLIGAGGGREVLALDRMGYEVNGAECHPKLVDYANRLLAGESSAAKVVIAPRDGMPDEDHAHYDGVIVGWGAYMLIPGRRNRILFLNRMRARVQVGSPLLLSFFPRRESDRRFDHIAAVANALRRPLGRELREVGDALAPNYVHYFTKTELASELAEAGFEIVGYWASPYGHSVARARS